MIKKIIAKVFKLRGRKIDKEFQNLLIGLKERKDEEFEAYAEAKFLELCKKQQKLCK